MALYNSFDLFIIQNQLQLTNKEWDIISEKYELNNEMMRLFQNKLNWEKIAKYQLLSIDFIKEFINYQLKDYINLICKYQELNENFINEYKDILNWELILEHQKLPAYFIMTHASEIQNFRDKMDYDEVD